MKIIESGIYNVRKSILDFFEVGSLPLSIKSHNCRQAVNNVQKTIFHLNRYKGKYDTIQCTQGKCEVKDYFYITHANCTSSTILDTYRTGCIEQIRRTFNVFRDFIQLDFTENGQQHIALCYLTNDVNINKI